MNTLFVLTEDGVLFKTNTKHYDVDFILDSIQRTKKDIEWVQDISEGRYYRIMDFNLKPITEVLEEISSHDLEVISKVMGLQLDAVETPSFYDIAFSLYEGIDEVSEAYIVSEQKEDSIDIQEGKVTFLTENGKRNLEFDRLVEI